MDNIEFLNRVIALTNAQRTQNGLAPLVLDARLSQAAQGHSVDMALNDYFGHAGSNGSTSGQRVLATGYEYRVTAENIAAGHATPEAVVQGWMDSPGHRANILNPYVQNIGVGYHFLPNDTGVSNYYSYWTQVFGMPLWGMPTGDTTSQPTNPATDSIAQPQNPVEQPTEQPTEQPSQPTEQPTNPIDNQPQYPVEQPAEPVTSPSGGSMPIPIEQSEGNTQSPVEGSNPTDGSSDLNNVTLMGTPGEDVLLGGDINDRIQALAGNDLVAGGLGNDMIWGGDGNDVLRGDRNDRLAGGTVGGDDIIYGGAGNDRIGGKAGNDTLFGDAGDDQIWGDDGDDLIRGGLGNDQIYGDNRQGGQGSDTFILAVGEGTDTIFDFEVGIDRIGLADGLTLGQIAIAQNGSHATLSVGTETLAILQNVSATALTEASFTTV